MHFLIVLDLFYHKRYDKSSITGHRYNSDLPGGYDADWILFFEAEKKLGSVYQSIRKYSRLGHRIIYLRNVFK